MILDGNGYKLLNALFIQNAMQEYFFGGWDGV